MEDEREMSSSSHSTAEDTQMSLFLLAQVVLWGEHVEAASRKHKHLDWGVLMSHQLWTWWQLPLFIKVHLLLWPIPASFSIAFHFIITFTLLGTYWLDRLNYYVSYMYTLYLIIFILHYPFLSFPLLWALSSQLISFSLPGLYCDPVSFTKAAYRSLGEGRFIPT